MDYTQLLYFKTVARLGNVTEASKELYVTQPNISRAVSRLEKELGVQFFDRVGGNRIELNHSGELFLARVERSFYELEEGVRELKDIESGAGGAVSFAIPQNRLLSALVAEYMRDHPQMRVNQSLHSYHESKQLLQTRDIDFAISFVRPGERESGILYEPLLGDEMFMLVSEDNPLANREEIELAEIRDMNVAINNSCVDYVQTFKRYCRQAGFEPRTVFEGDDSSVMHDLLHNNLVVSPIPAVLQMRMDTGNEPAGLPSKRILPLRIVAPECRYELGIVTLEGHYMTKVSRSFLAYLKSKLPELFEKYREEFYARGLLSRHLRSGGLGSVEFGQR